MINTQRLECLALAIAQQNDALNPGSEAFATLNPGLLKGYSLDRLNVVNESGIRVFKSFHAGYRALVGNLEAKCNGKTKANGQSGKLSPESTLIDLVKTFQYIQTRKVVEYLQDALDDRAIGETTPLGFFIEGNNGHS